MEFVDTSTPILTIQSWSLPSRGPLVRSGTVAEQHTKTKTTIIYCLGAVADKAVSSIVMYAIATYECNMPCLREKMRAENRYYAAVKHLYSNVTTLYPDAEIWLAGHSLGGALSGLLGLTYGRPAVTFEAIPDALPARRLGLPFPPGEDPDRPQARRNTGNFHFGITSDPVYLGTCNGATASCSFAGYALESACHTGMECVYDVVKDWGWRVWIGTHSIDKVIDNVIKKYDTVPKCRFTPDCVDCAQWKEKEGDLTTTSSRETTTRTRSRTSTCRTPGWWGCLDEKTTTTTGLKSSMSSVTATTTG